MYLSHLHIKNHPILKDLNLDLINPKTNEPYAVVAFVGENGCGKTTILRMISGLEHVTEGRVFIDGIDVTEVDPTKREVNTIFQNFALFPHMTVFENVAFGLKMKKVKKQEKNIVEKFSCFLVNK